MINIKLCACGCGLPVEHNWNKFIIYHASHLRLTKEQNPNLASFRKGLSQIDEYGKIRAAKMRKANSIAQKKVWKDHGLEIELHRTQIRALHIKYPWLTYNKHKKIEQCTINGRIICEQCHNEIIGYKRCHLHHKDKNRKNNILDNLMIVCAKCHTYLDNHKRSKTNGRFV